MYARKHCRPPTLDLPVVTKLDIWNDHIDLILLTVHTWRTRTKCCWRCLAPSRVIANGQPATFIALVMMSWSFHQSMQISTHLSFAIIELQAWKHLYDIKKLTWVQCFWSIVSQLQVSSNRRDFVKKPWPPLMWGASSSIGEEFHFCPLLLFFTISHGVRSICQSSITRWPNETS